jgi:hypothetical protein
MQTVEFRGNFSSRYDPVSYTLKRDSGTIYVHNTCGLKANEEHEGRECSSCRNWNGCSTGNCTLSGVYCLKCEVRASI